MHLENASTVDATSQTELSTLTFDATSHREGRFDKIEPMLTSAVPTCNTSVQTNTVASYDPLQDPQQHVTIHNNSRMRIERPFWRCPAMVVKYQHFRVSISLQHHLQHQKHDRNSSQPHRSSAKMQEGSRAVPVVNSKLQKSNTSIVAVTASQCESWC